MTDTLLISDLHLSTERPEVVGLFLRFLEEQASQADRLYILGDLFDAWIGDDNQNPPIPDIAKAMNRTARAGCKLFFMHGNRDFLIGPAFLQAAGCELLEDPSVVEIGGVATLLMHGDLLCSDDLEYQQARHLLRSQAFIDDFLTKSVPERLALAAEYRKKSGEVISNKSAEIMDVAQQTVADFMHTHRVSRLVHGHTHRPAIHDFELDGQTVQRIVLADWQDDAASYLRINDTAVSVETLAP